MSELINFLTSKEIIMVYIVAAIACALYFVIHYVDKFYYQKRKQKQNTKELNRLVEDINYELAKEREEEQPTITESTNEEVIEEPIYIEPVLEQIEKELVVEAEEVETIEISEPIEVIEEIKEVVENIEVTPEVIKEEVEEIEVNNQEIDEPKVEEETLDYTTAEPNQTEAQAELRKLTEALEQAEETSKNIDLTSYEEMQEKEAIISLEELMKRSKEMYESNELTQYVDEGNEPISLEDLERKVKESLEIEETVEITTEPVIEQIEMTEILETSEPEIINSVTPEKFAMDDFYTVHEETKTSPTAYKQYKSMPIISPVYGIEKKATNTELELENTANYEKLDEEIKKTNEFIMTLKELQQNLD